MTDKERRLSNLSLLGIPVGILGFLLEPGWIQYLIFAVGGVACGLGWVLDLKIQADRTLEKKGKRAKNERIN